MSSKSQQEELMTLAFQVGRQLRKAMQRDGLAHDDSLEKVSQYQVHALMALIHHATTMSELAEEMSISLPSATALIDRLVKNGWVERGPDPHDRRITRLSVTTKGTTVCRAMKAKRLQAFKFLMDAMPNEDVEALRRILSNLHATLEERQGRKH